jgi:peptidylamidoglycolate lyase
MNESSYGRRQFLRNSLVAAAVVSPFGDGLAAGADPDPTVLGQGKFRYRMVKDWSFKRDSSPVDVADCHEFVRTKSGNLILCTTHTANNLIEFTPDGKVVQTFGTTYPGIHGLSISEENGEEFLWITDTKRRIVCKLDRKGKEIMTLGWPKETGKYTEEKQFMPTETAINPANGDIYVADGYGSNYLTHYNAKGDVKGCYRHEGFNCIHGVAIDDRDAANPKLLVTSRAANKLFTLSLTGENLGHVDLPGAWICRPVVSGENVFFAVINSGRLKWGSDFRGFVMVLDKDNKPVSLIGGQPPTAGAEGEAALYRNIEPKPFLNCHDVCLDAEGNLYVAHWASKKTHPYKLVPVA